jgi:hypothetical protein
LFAANVHPAAEDEGGCHVVQRLEDAPHTGPDPLRGCRCTPARAARVGLGDSEEVRALGVVEAQRTSHRVENVVGHIEVAALFEAAVVIHAHTRKLRDLFATQARYPSRPPCATDIDVVDTQARSAGPEEVPQLRVVLHQTSLTPIADSQAHKRRSARPR